MQQNHPSQADDTLESPDDRFPTISELEKAHIRKALKKTAGNKSKAADLLGINRDTLARKQKELSGVNENKNN